MERKPFNPTMKASGANFTGDVYGNPIYRGQARVAARAASDSRKREWKAGPEPEPRANLLNPIRRDCYCVADSNTALDKRSMLRRLTPYSAASCFLHAPARAASTRRSYSSEVKRSRMARGLPLRHASASWDN